MKLEEFKTSVLEKSPPEDLTDLLLALWYDAKGNWDKAHKITQDIRGEYAAWVHAYLHRKEGDNGNASYWYSRAGKPFPGKSLDEEWEVISGFLLSVKG